MKPGFRSNWIDLSSPRIYVLSPARDASGSLDETIKLWDATIGGLQKTLAGHSHQVSAVAFSPNGKQIASGSLDKTIKLWDATTGGLQKTLAGYSNRVNAIAFSPDGKQIASGSEDETIKLRDAMTGGLQKTLAGYSDSITAVAFSPNGKQVASGSWDKTIKWWDATTGGLQKTLAGHSNRVKAIAFSPDGKQIASGSEDKTIKLWDIAKSLEVSKFLGSTLSRHLKFGAWRRKIDTLETVSSLKFSTDGHYLDTNLGEIKIEKVPTSRQSSDFESLNNLWVRFPWVYYGAVPVFLLPTDFEPGCYDINGDQVAIGLRNGRVLSFDIDRVSLNLIYEHLV